MNGQDLSASNGPERDEIGSITLTWSTCSRKQTIYRKYLKMPAPPSNQMLISDKLPIILLGEAFHRILSFFSATQIVSNHFGVGEHLNIIKILEKVGLGERWRGAPAHLSSPSAKRQRAVIDRQSLNSETTRDI